MNYYLGEILERNGELEYNCKYLFATSKNPDKYTDKIARDWRCSSKKDWDDYCQGYWANDTLIFADGCKEIPKEDFEVLQKYLSVL